jgi:TonB-linked SusC/RagA family outer membrane protein
MLLLAFIAIPVLADHSSLQQQSKTITGTVTDENDEPLIGVRVFVPGSSVGTTTNADGKFRLDIPSDKSTVRISYLGYQTQTLSVGNRTDFNTRLVPENKELDEVVIVGYGTQRVKDLTGAATVVRMDDVEYLPGASIVDALAGQVVGLSVTKSSGRPGSTGTFKVREPAPPLAGGVSYGPLIVIDDVVQVNTLGEPDMTAFNMLDYSEIESMTVLKDASAAVYGSRSSQGVILVKTRRGKIGTPKISYSTKMDFSDAVSHIKTMNAYETGVFTNRMINQIHKNGGTDYTSYLYSGDELNTMKGLNYDWLDRAWNPAISQRHSLNMDGGTENITYFAGISYQNQETNLGKVQDFDKWTFRTGGEMKVMSGLKLSASISAYNGTTVSNQAQAISSDYVNLRRMPKFIPIEVTTDQGTYWMSPYVGPHYVNTTTNDQIANTYPAWNYFANEASGADKTNKSNGYGANFSLIYDVPFLKGLTLKGTYAINYANTFDNAVGAYYQLARARNTNQEGMHLIGDYTTWDYPQYGRGTNNKPLVTYNKAASKSEQINFMLNYNRTFGAHDIALTGVVERGEAEGTRMQLYYDGPWDSYNGVSSSAGTLNTDGGKSYFTKTESGSLSYIGRFNYKYATRYLAQFLIRSDASTKFAPENYWGTFPTGSVGWVTSEESFFKNGNISKHIDYLKLRYSLGKTGKDNVRAWSWMPAFTVNPNSGLGFGTIDGAPSFGAIFNGTVNRNIKWDQTIKRNVGIDMNVLSNRLGLTVDYFYDKTSDLIMRVAATDEPIYIGANLPYLNYGNVDAWGWEFSLRWTDKINQSLLPKMGAIKYAVGIDYGISWHKVVKGEEPFFDYPAIIKNEGGKTGYISPGEQYGFKIWKETSQGDGILRTQQDIDKYWQYLTDLATAAGGQPSYLGITSKDRIYPGMLAYQDVAGDIDAENKTIAGPNGIVSKDHGQDFVKLASNRKHNINTRMSVAWGDFNWSAQIATSWGGYYETYNDDTQAISNSAIIWSQFSYLNDMFDPVDNPNGKYPSMAVSNTYGERSDFWMVPTFRCYVRNMTFGYALPKNLLKQTRIDKLQVSLTGNNLWDFYNPYPDNFRNMYDEGDSGYPTLRTWTLGVNVTF